MVLWSACHPMMLYISTYFHKHIWNGFELIQGNQNYYCQTSKGNDSKIYRQELHYFWSAHHLMMLYISVKFHENVLKGFLLIQRTATKLPLSNFK